MKRELSFRTAICVLCVSCLFLMNGFSGMALEAKEREVPIGEMVSRGEVRFEARENQWREVDSSYFPIFQGIKIKTEKGAAIVALGDNTQLELGPDSIVFFEQSNRLNLSQGRIDFRIPPGSEMSIRVKGLSVTLPRPLQASKGPSGVPESRKETLGSMLVHPNGAVTVKSLQGSLSIVGQDRTVLATLSSKDAMTIPSVMSTVPLAPQKPQRLAQAGDSKEDRKDHGKILGAGAGTAAGAAAGAFLGLSNAFWLATGIVAGGSVGILAYEEQRGPTEEIIPACCPECPRPVLCR
jgi:hypothetical protein